MQQMETPKNIEEALQKQLNERKLRKFSQNDIVIVSIGGYVLPHLAHVFNFTTLRRNIK